MNKLLKDYVQFLVDDSDLITQFGTPLIQARVSDAEREFVTNTDVIKAIKKFRVSEISLQTFVDWVNTLWFVDSLFVYRDDQIDSIASVMDLLEELDEEGVTYTDDEYNRMITALESNAVFIK